ncbi:hypothetical protein EON66_04285 [archaeon]|nr:MAG: hypothetical protein EON66_04285 [archaeon]
MAMENAGYNNSVGCGAHVVQCARSAPRAEAGGTNDAHQNGGEGIVSAGVQAHHHKQGGYKRLVRSTTLCAD